MFRTLLLPWLVLWLYRAWSWTWRLSVVEPDSVKKLIRERAPVVFAHWHGGELCLVPMVRPYRIATMTSTSKDGELMDFVINRFGGKTSRGSSTRGGVQALKGLVRLVKSGRCASVAVDGPKGPIHQVKPGVFEVSRLAAAYIVPAGTACDRGLVFEKSWNKARLPWPFAKVCVQFLEPWEPLTRDVSSRDSALARRLEVEIANACQLAEQHLR